MCVPTTREHNPFIDPYVCKVIGSDAVNRYFLVMVLVWVAGLHNAQIFLHMFNNPQWIYRHSFFTILFLSTAWYFFPNFEVWIIQIFFSYNKRWRGFESKFFYKIHYEVPIELQHS